MISRITGRRFILSGNLREVHATVVSESPVTAGEAYRAFLSILDLNGMTVVPSGPYLRIIEAEHAVTEPIPIDRDGDATPDDERYVTRMHRVTNVSAEDVAALLARFASEAGNITAYAPTNTIIITDTGANIRRMLRILVEVDVPRTNEQLWIEPVHHASAADLAARIGEIFPSATEAASGHRDNAANEASGPRVVGATARGAHLTKVIADERTNSLIIMATERAYLRVLEVIRALDVPVEGEGSIHVHSLQYADSEEIGATLQSLLGGAASAGGSAAGEPARSGAPAVAAFEGRIAIQPNESTNSLLITASRHDYAALRSIIEQLDTAPRQVFIEAVIMELTVHHTNSVGVSYHGGAGNAPATGAMSVFGFDAGDTATSSIDPSMLSGLALGVRGSPLEQASQLLGFSIPTFGVMLHALATSNDVNVLSTPHIMAMDNQQAEITVGANVPLQTSGIALGSSLSSLSALAGNAGNAGSALSAASSLASAGGGQRQNVGTTLRITPHINESNEIRLEIEEEISEAEPAQGTLGVVPISQRIAKTQVVVRDQQTVVIGGLMRDRTTTDDEGIPVLSDIPLLGALFRHRQTTSQRTNLLLFLTPYVIRSPDDLRAIFERNLRERQEFIDRYFVLTDRDHRPAVDYSRTRGLVTEILDTVARLDAERAQRDEMLLRPAPREHVPSAPLGEASFEAEGELTIGPDDEASALGETDEPPSHAE